MNTHDLAEILNAGSEAMLGRKLSAFESDQMLAYLALLQRWNAAYNLTAIRDPLEMVTRHVLDSLSILPWVKNGPVLDAGAGAGLPGVPLAILRPDLQFTLLDSAGKKARFLRQVKRELGLDNIQPLQARLETHLPAQPYQVIISRAFSSLQDFATASRQLMSDNTRLLAMKGRDPAHERKDLPGWIKVDSVQELVVPGLQEQRHLVIMSLTQ
ncbi:MAG: 16S rRNA (guanine(527)-N(7))-methyltransferase RsmG [Xanthomonadales bacterium]|nr:16S rRNA (guanine(527)-N(7))-methyltransferase RsmG [Xanthomonadales bacterium]